MKRAGSTWVSLLVAVTFFALVSGLVPGSAPLHWARAQIDPVGAVWLPFVVKAPVTMTTLAVEGNTLYLGTDSSLTLVDVTDPVTPTQRASLALAQPARAIAINAGFVYVVTAPDQGGLGSLTIIDARQPDAPQIVSQRDMIGPQDIAFAGDTAYVKSCSLPTVATGCTLSVFGVSDPAQPSLIQELTLLSPPGRTTSVAPMQVRGGYLYLAYGYIPTLCCSTGMLEIFAIQDPGHVSRVGQYSTGGGLREGIIGALGVLDTTAYVASLGVGKLTAINISDPANPTSIANIALPSGADDMQIIASLAYVTSGFNPKITIIDVGDPAAMRPVGELTTSGPTASIRVQLDRAFVVDTVAGVRILDVSDPMQPRLLGIFVPG